MISNPSLITNQGTNRIPILLFLILIWAIPASISYARILDEDEKLIRVGVGAYQDGFYEIAEKQFSQFLQEYPDHSKIYDILYLLGKVHFDQGKFNEARAHWLRVANENKTFEPMDYLLFWLGEVEWMVGNLEGARRYFISVATRFPKFDALDHVYYRLALIEMMFNRPSQSEAHFKKLLAISKNSILLQTSHFWMGTLAFKQNRFEEASDFFKKASDHRAPSPLYPKYALLWLADSMLKQGKLQEAHTLYGILKERYKDDPIATEVLWKIGYSSYRRGHSKEAIEAFRAYQSIAKESFLALFSQYLLGQIYLQNQDYETSLKELQPILNRAKEHPLWGVVFVSLFWNHIQQQNPSEARKILQRIQKVSTFDDEKTFLQWLNGEIAFWKGNLSDALPYYFNVLNTNYREKALFRICQIYFFDGKWKEALTNLDILLLEFPNSPHIEESLFMKGECLQQSGQLNHALEAFRLLIQKGNRTPWKILALTQTGNIHLAKQEEWEAERTYKKIIEDFSTHPLATYAAFQLGKLFFKQNNVFEAIHYYSLILKWNRLEWLGGTYFSLGEIFYQQGKYEKAQKSFEMALRYLQESSPWFFLTHLEIGNLQKKVGQYDEAKRSYLTILNQSKDEELKRAANDLLRVLEKRD